MRVYHGDIVTVNSNDDVFQYLVENRGRIIYVGNDLPAKYSKAEVIELGTRALIPPFADTHQHLASFSALYPPSKKAIAPTLSSFFIGRSSRYVKFLILTIKFLR